MHRGDRARETECLKKKIMRLVTQTVWNVTSKYRGNERTNAIRVLWVLGVSIKKVIFSCVDPTCEFFKGSQFARWLKLRITQHSWFVSRVGVAYF